MDNKNINTKPLTKKEEADAAGSKVAEEAAKGLARASGGKLGSDLVNFAGRTKGGQRVFNNAGKKLSNSSPFTRYLLAKGYENMHMSKPNSLVDSMGGTSDSPTSNINGMDDYTDSYDEVDNNTTDVKGNGIVSGIFKELPLKAKIGVIAALVFIVIFLVVLITPLMSFGIIDISGISSGSSGGISYGYSSISGSTTYWWPIGSSGTTTIGGAVYAGGTPSHSSITSNYGMRIHPISGEKKMHTGVDIADGSTPGTTNIIAVQDGIVTYPSNGNTVSCPTSSSLDGCGGGYGNYVMIQHSDGVISLYAHLHQNSITVRKGDVVKQGQVIGKMGSSGNSTGTHLHFELRSGGSTKNPLGFVSMDNPRPKIENVGYISGDSNKQSVCLTLKAAGFSDNSVGALLTNIGHESSFNPTAVGDNGTSYGLCQWHNDRNANLKAAYPDSYHTIDSQINFLLYELEEKYVGVHTALVNGSDSASDLTYNFCVNFENPKDAKTTCSNRASESSSYYNYVKNGCK